MAKARSAPVVAQQFTRSEGHALRLLKMPSMVDSPDSQFVTFGLDMSSAPVPQRRYMADVCAIRLANDDFKFIFGQERLDGDGLDSALVVRFNAYAALTLLASIEEMDRPSLAVIANTCRISPQPLIEITKQPSQTAILIANLAAIAVSGFDTCIDFYYASPFAIRKSHRSEQLEVESVVRVDMRTASFIAFCAELRRLCGTLPPEIKESNHGTI